MSRRDWDAERGPNPEGTEDCRDFVPLTCAFAVVKRCVFHVHCKEFELSCAVRRNTMPFSTTHSFLLPPYPASYSLDHETLYLLPATKYPSNRDERVVFKSYYTATQARHTPVIDFNRKFSLLIA